MKQRKSILDWLRESEGVANGEAYKRIQFETFEDLEAYFLAECWGKPGLRTKVIGTVLLIQQRKESK